MHRYLMCVPKYFGSQFRFEVEATDENDAIQQAKEYISNMPGRENMIFEGLVCVRKLAPSFGEDYEKKMQSMR